MHAVMSMSMMAIFYSRLNDFARLPHLLNSNGVSLDACKTNVLVPFITF